jgi:hypothetical protein
MAASPCGPWSIPRAQRTPLLWRKSDLMELWGTKLLEFADSSNRVSPFDGEPAPCEGDLKMIGGLAPTGTCNPSRWHAGSNDQCEQFNDAYSDHQHSKCYGVVIEPMRPLYI